MLRQLIPLLIAASLLAVVCGGKPEVAGDLAIVVNKSSAIHALSSEELRTIYLGERSVWSDGRKVVPVAFGPGSPELRLLLKAICRMSEADYKRYFIQMSFEGKTITPPRILSSSEAVRTFVGSNPGAIGLIYSHQVNTTVSVIKLNGAAPGDPAYKLSNR
jgi:ABC-type phosphate transport system substrate-binding protein